MRDDSANTLDGHPVTHKHKHKAVKSSLKGSRSQLSLEEVAQAARRNAALKNTRLAAQTTLHILLQGINNHAEGRDADAPAKLASTSYDGSTCSETTAPPEAPQAVVIACSDCDLPLPESFGAAASDIAVLRTPGNVVTPGVAASVGQLIEEGGARLVVVLGHTQCAAADRAVDAWLERHRDTSLWPWATAAAAAAHPSAAAAAAEPHADELDAVPPVPGWQPAPSLGPPKEPRESGSSSGSDEASSSGSGSSGGSKAAEEPVRTDKISTMGVPSGKGVFVRNLLSCYCGAGIDEDESHHPRGGAGGDSPENSLEGSLRGCALVRSRSCAAALNCADRTVVRTLGDTMDLAVDEVALQRVADAEEETRSRNFRALRAHDGGRLPIEAPRAPRSNSNLSTSRHAEAADAAAATSQARVIGRDERTAAEVVGANAKLAAEALLRALSKRVGAGAMRELEAVALVADVDTRRTALLRKGWYHSSCYYFE